MAFKTLIFLGLLAVSLGYVIPESQQDDYFAEPTWIRERQIPLDDNVLLIRTARSPQRNSLSANYGYSRGMGSSAGIDYNRQIGKNFEAYVGGSRNFRFNDNSAHAGLRYRF